MSFSSRLASGLLLLVTAGGLASASSSPRVHPVLEASGAIRGIAPAKQFTISVACGDVNRDHVPDVVVGSPVDSPQDRFHAGSVSVFSGRNGHLLRRLDGPDADGIFGLSVTTEDLNRDGYADVLVGAPNDAGGRVYVYSGKDGHLLRRIDGQPGAFQLGFTVRTCDLDRDGTPDIVVGAPNQGGGGDGKGRVFVFSGKTGVLLRTLVSDEAGSNFGQAVACGDVNRDGYPDLLVGAPLAAPNGLFHAGSTFVYSGQDLSLLHRYDGTADSDLMGIGVAAADLDGDRYPDVLTSAPLADPGGLTNAGSVFAYSGRTGSLLRRFDGVSPDDHFGDSVAVGLLDRDRSADVVVGAANALAGETRPGSVFVYSGKGGALLQRFDGEQDLQVFGIVTALCPGGRSHGPRLVVGAPSTTSPGTTNTEAVYLFSATRWAYR